MPRPSQPNTDTPRRLAGTAVAAAALTPLTLAAVLAPASEGHGTHTQLGLPACGWVVAFDKPCPTCGMTTAFTHAADGDLLTAALTQPFGAALAVAAGAVFWAGLHIALTGCRLTGLLNGLLSARSLWILAAAALLAWVYKLLSW